MDWWVETVQTRPLLLVVIMLGVMVAMVAVKLGAVVLYARFLGPPKDLQDPE